MHEWFTTPIADARSEAAVGRARAHNLRVASGRDLWSRTARPVATRAARAAVRLDTRRVDAAVAALLGDAPRRPQVQHRPRAA